MYIRSFSGLTAIGSLLLLSLSAGAQLEKPPADLLPNVPANFTRFVMPNQPEVAQLFNRYTWYFWNNRVYNSNVMFYQEYMTMADMWLNDAVDSRRKITIQAAHRDDLATTLLHRSGYVHTQQCFSHGDDWGWPFPLWEQSQAYIPGDPNSIYQKNTTFGWCFQTKVPDWWIDGPYLLYWQGLQGECLGESATRKWELTDLQSEGISEEKWQLKATGPNPTITSPSDVQLQAYQCPYMQIRWLRDVPKGQNPKAVIEWMRVGDKSFSADRRIEFDAQSEPTELEKQIGYIGTDTIMGPTEHTWHSIIPMFKHPKWLGKIARFRIRLAPDSEQAKFQIDSIFSAYDTRHTINNPLFVMGSWNVFRWTGDLDFLRKQIDRMRMACKYQMEQMGGLKYGHIRNTWPGHDGLPGWGVDNKKLGKRVIYGGHGIGNCYYDVMPFGWDDAYATNQYYGMLITMERIERLIAQHPEWKMPHRVKFYTPGFLAKHAAKVKQTANKLFWNDKAGRFIGSIDKDGVRRDYGFTFVNQDSIWYDIATPQHARQIMDWITGKRIVAGDTSQGADIFRFEFGPRTSTKRNIDWYGQGWFYPESIPWGGQIQHGGAVLGFEFYDLWARMKVYGIDNAWQQFARIAKYEKAVMAAGGYRKYYADGTKGSTLQGGGPPGGIGIDYEFLESAVLPAFIVNGFLGINPDGQNLLIKPNLPKACPSIGIRKMRYRNCTWNIQADGSQITVELLDKPSQPVSVCWYQGGKLKSHSFKTPGLVKLKR
ncbi:MAG: glucosidase family protein [Armatimonadota bacterium]